jgi:hypothetical protein
MAFAFLEPKDLNQTYKDAKKYMEPVFEPLDEYERIARNKPHPGIAKELPKVTDGTLAALIQEQPKRVIQQIPTAKVESKDPWLDVVASFIFEQEILRNSDYQAALIQKCWAGLSKALTYGSQPALVQFLNRGDYFGTDFSLPYIKDVILEPGKLSDRDSNFMFLKAWYTERQIDTIIAKEQMLAQKAKGRNEKYDGMWDLAKLAEAKDKKKTKDAKSLTPNERSRNGELPGVIEIVHAFQRGAGAEFYSFSPDLDSPNNIVRRKVNKDPRGMIPIHYLYMNVDLSNPIGRGAVEISGGMQNLLDSEVQSYQYMRALMMNPPIMKWGDVMKSTLKYAPNAIWDMGTNTQNKVEVAQLESASLQQFPTNYGLIKSQILNLNSSTDTSVSSDSGNPGFSKTPQGVKTNEARLGISDNYMRRQYEDWFQEIGETELNLYFAERSGTQELQLDQETAAKLGALQPGAVNEQGQIRVNYDSETKKLQLKVDPTSSSVKDNQEQFQALSEMIQQVGADPLIVFRMAQAGYNFNLGEAYREMYSTLGIKNLPKIIKEMTEQEKQQAAQQPMPVMDKPKITIGFDDLADLPEAQQAVLKDAGNELPIEVFQQAAQVRQQMEMAKNAPEPQEQEHPLVKLMAQLDIKFTDLGEDTQRFLIENLFNAPANEPLPGSVTTQAKASDSALKVAALHHQITKDTQAHELAVAQAHQQATQAGHQQGLAAVQADKQHQLAVANASQQAVQADRTHKLAEKTAAMKPKVSAK